MKKSVIFIFILFSCIVRAEKDTTVVNHNDPWIAYDKFLHFSVSASIVLSTQYTLVEKLDYKNDDAIYFSMLVSGINGMLKEIWDSKQPNGFISKKDIVANIAGIIFGVFIIRL